MAKAAEIPGLDAAMTYAEAAARTVAVRGEEVFEHSEGVLDTGDIERVHAMRVATRRLRAVMEVYAPCFDREELRPVLRDVKALADALGARRDPDVELLALEQFAASIGPDERPGVELFIDRTRAEQSDGNRLLAEALANVEQTDLRGRIAALAMRTVTPEDQTALEGQTATLPAWPAGGTAERSADVARAGSAARTGATQPPSRPFAPPGPERPVESDHTRPVNGGWS